MYLLLLPLTLAVSRGLPFSCDEESGALHLLQAKGHYVLAADKKILKGVSRSALILAFCRWVKRGLA